MKKLYFLVIALCFFNHLQSQIINFPDPKFKWWLLLTSYGATIASQTQKQPQILIFLS